MILQEACALADGPSGSGAAQQLHTPVHSLQTTPKKQRQPAAPAHMLSPIKKIGKSTTPRRSPARPSLARQQMKLGAGELPDNQIAIDRAHLRGSMQHGQVPGEQQRPPVPHGTFSLPDALEVSALLIATFYTNFAVLTCPAGPCDLATS